MRLNRSRLMIVVLGVTACAPDLPFQPSGSSPASVVEDDRLLTLEPTPSLTPRASSRLSRIGGRASSRNVSVGRINPSASQFLRRDRRVALPLPSGKTLVAVGKQERVHKNGLLSWGGAPADGSGWVQAVLGPAGVYATIVDGNARYSIEPLGEGLHAVVELDDAKFVEHPTSVPTGAKEGAGTSLHQGSTSLLFPKAQVAGSANASLVLQPVDAPLASYTESGLDVLVLFTDAAVSATANISSLIQLSVDNTNTAYANSYIALTASVAALGQITADDYSEAGRSLEDHLAALVNSADGKMDVVHGWRNANFADVVVLIVDDNEACGIAGGILASASSAFAVVHQSCAAANYSFAHEIGHLQGARHDMDRDATLFPFQYGHGYKIPDAFRTVMAYPCAIEHPCPRHHYFSTPLYGPGPILTHGTETYEDNARVLNETKAYVTGFRVGPPPPPPPPSFSVNVSGQTYLDPNVTYTWYASVSNGASPYTYDWAIDGAPAGTGSGVSSSFAASTQHDIQLIAWDSQGQSASAVLTVDVGTGQCPPEGCSMRAQPKTFDSVKERRSTTTTTRPVPKAGTVPKPAQKRIGQ